MASLMLSQQLLLLLYCDNMELYSGCICVHVLLFLIGAGIREGIEG